MLISKLVLIWTNHVLYLLNRKIIYTMQFYTSFYSIYIYGTSQTELRSKRYDLHKKNMTWMQNAWKRQPQTFQIMNAARYYDTTWKSKQFSYMEWPKQSYGSTPTTNTRFLVEICRKQQHSILHTWKQLATRF